MVIKILPYQILGQQVGIFCQPVACMDSYSNDMSANNPLFEYILDEGFVTYK